MIPEKIILDMDNGLSLPVADSDDGMALALALASPEIELLGITTCAGNCRARQSTHNTLVMLDLAGCPSIPVAQGREEPLVRDRRAHFAYLEHKRAGPEARFWAHLPPVPATNLQAQACDAQELIIDAVRGHPGQVTLVMTGSLTNLARALLAAPDLAFQIKAVLHMGGAFAPQQPGDPPIAWKTPDIPDEVWHKILRFNPRFDPEAAAIVFRSGLHLTLVPVNITRQVFQRLEHLNALASSPLAFHRHLLRYGMPWVHWSREIRGLPGAHMHDPLTLALVIDPTFCSYRRMRVDVEALLAGREPWLDGMDDGPRANVAVGVDAKRFEHFLAQRLKDPPRRAHYS